MHRGDQHRMSAFGPGSLDILYQIGFESSLRLSVALDRLPFRRYEQTESTGNRPVESVAEWHRGALHQ